MHVSPGAAYPLDEAEAEDHARAPADSRDEVEVESEAASGGVDGPTNPAGGGIVGMRE